MITGRRSSRNREKGTKIKIITEDKLPHGP